MKPRRLLGLITTAAFVLAAIFAIPAHALPEFLLSEGKLKTFTSKDTGAATFENTARDKDRMRDGLGRGSKPIR